MAYDFLRFAWQDFTTEEDDKTEILSRLDFLKEYRKIGIQFDGTDGTDSDRKMWENYRPDKRLWRTQRHKILHSHIFKTLNIVAIHDFDKCTKHGPESVRKIPLNPDKPEDAFWMPFVAVTSHTR